MNDLMSQNDLIKVDYNTMTVSARDLHEGLEIGTRFNDWFPRMTSYGFTENVDYTLVTQKRETNNPKNPITEYIDYKISIDMAKQICMIQRTEKGKQYRQYFIDLEKAWNTPEQIMARALKMADQTINNLKYEIEEKNNKIVQQQEEIKHKDDVNKGLVKDISLSEKRQILNRVVKKGGYRESFQKRWGALYREFEQKYHMDLKRRIEKYNKEYKQFNEDNKEKIKKKEVKRRKKIESKVDYIDVVLNQIPDLYDLACKLYENDVKALIEEMYYTIKPKKTK